MSLLSSKLILNNISRQSLSKHWVPHKQSILVQSLSARNNTSVHEKLYSTTSRATSHFQQNSSSTTQNGTTSRSNDRDGRNYKGPTQIHLLQIQQMPWNDAQAPLNKINGRARFSSLATSDSLTAEALRSNEILADVFSHDKSGSASAESDIQSRTGAFNAHILTLKRAHDLDGVLAEFEAMKHKGIPCNLYTYNLVLDAMASLRMENSPIIPLLRIYNEMLMQNIAPTAFTYTTLVKTLCRRDSEIRLQLSQISRRKEEGEAWGAMAVSRSEPPFMSVDLLLSEQPIAHALAVFDAAVQTKRVEEMDLEAFNLLLKALANQETKSTSDALYVFEHLEKSKNIRCRPNTMTYLHLLEIYGRAGDLQGAKEVFEEYRKIMTMRRFTNESSMERYQIYKAFVEANLLSGNIEGAMDILLKIVPQDGIRRNAQGFSMVIHHLIQHGEIEKAQGIVHKLIEAKDETSRAYREGYVPVTSTTLSPLLDHFVQVDNLDMATSYFNLIMSLPSPQIPSNTPFIHYVRALTRMQRWNDVLSVARSLRSRNLAIDPRLAEEAMRGMLAVQDSREPVTLRLATEFLYELAETLRFRNIPITTREWGNELATRVLSRVEPPTQGFKSSLEVSNVLFSLKSFSPATASLLIDSYIRLRANSEQWSMLRTQLTQNNFATLTEILFFRNVPFATFKKDMFNLLEDIQGLGLSPPVSAYTRVLVKLRKHREDEAAENWIRAFQGLKLPLERNEENSKVAVEGIQLHLTQTEGDDRLARRWGPSSREYPVAVTLQSDVHSTDIMTAVMAGEYDKAARLTEHLVLNGMTPSPDVMRDVINNVGKNNHLDLAETIWKLADRSFERLPPHRARRARQMCLSSLMAGYAINKDILKAKEIYNQIKKMNMFPDANAYASLLLGTSEESHDEAEDAARILEEARSHNIRLNNFFYNVVISKFGKGRRADDALAVFEEVKKQKMGNTVTYGAIVSACLRGGAETTAEKLFEEMALQQNYQPRVGVFHSMMAHFAREQPNRMKALQYFEMLKMAPTLKPNAHTYKLLMEAYATIDPYDILGAEMLLTEMQEKGIIPEPSHFATLVYARGVLLKDLEGAKKVYEEISKRGLAPDDAACQALLDAYISNGDLSSAEHLRKNFLTNHQTTTYIENLFIRGYADAGRLADAEAIFDAMVDSNDPNRPADMSRVVLREPSTYEMMVRTYMAAGETDKARAVLGVMETRGWPDKIVKGIRELVYNVIGD